MKISILISLILCTSIAFVGCSSSKSDESSNTQSESIIQVDNTKDKEALNEKVIKEFEVLLPKVENAYAENNIEVKDSYNSEDKIYNKTSHIRYKGEPSKEHKGLSSSSFRISFDEEGLATAIDWTTYLTMDENIMSSEEFNIEDTFLGAMSELMISDTEHNSKFNEVINDYYKNGGDGSFEFSYENIRGSAVIIGNELSYTIQYK